MHESQRPLLEVSFATWIRQEVKRIQMLKKLPVPIEQRDIIK